MLKIIQKCANKNEQPINKLPDYVYLTITYKNERN